MILILLATSKASYSGASRTNAFFFPSRPDQGVDFGHPNITELLHSLFVLVHVGLDTNILLTSIFFMVNSELGGN